MSRIIVVLIGVAALAFAQSERGNITGIVSDPTGAAIPGAELSVINAATNATTKTVATSSGEYNVANLLPGTYRMEITAEGFKRFLQQNIIVSAGGTLRVDAMLQLGQVNEQIEVSASAATIQTENAKVSTLVENRLVDELPLVVAGSMRSPFNLPSVEALTEFAVDTSGFKAEYGQAGGGVMTFASKSGTIIFHGTAYDFLRNDALDAHGFFGRTRSVYRQNDFGATASGPVYIPKVYDGRNKSLFFVSYEGFRNRVGANDTIL